MKKKVIAICGKSGSGKDTIMKKLVQVKPDIFHSVVSYTSRNKRSGEKEGVDYNFISREKFAELIIKGEMLEVTEFNDWLYGTGVNSLVDDKINIGVYNPEGIEYLAQSTEINLMVFYITADDKIRLMRSLTREDNPNVDEIIRRFGTDKTDFLDFDTRLNLFNITQLENNTENDLISNFNLILRLAKDFKNI